MEHHVPYILLVEDDYDDQMFFIEGLVRLCPQVKVKVSDTGYQALSFLAACPLEELPAVIVIDYDMSFLNGAEVLFHLAAVPCFAAIPKIILSESDHHLSSCRSLGAREYFVKAYSEVEMNAIVARVLAVMAHA